MEVLMVCLGNICRSPLAQGILEHHIVKNGLNWVVDSAGTSNWHSGQAPDDRSIEVARKNGIDISGQRARQLNRSDFQQFDLIFAMDQSNLRDLTNLAQTEEEKDKIELIMNLVDPGKNIAVPDPYWDNDGFDIVFKMLDNACSAFVKEQSKKQAK